MGKHWMSDAICNRVTWHSTPLRNPRQASDIRMCVGRTSCGSRCLAGRVVCVHVSARCCLPS